MRLRSLYIVLLTWTVQLALCARCPCSDPPKENDSFIEFRSVDDTSAKLARSLCIDSRQVSQQTNAQNITSLSELLILTNGVIASGTLLWREIAIEADDNTWRVSYDGVYAQCDVSILIVSDESSDQSDRSLLTMDKRRKYKCPGGCLQRPIVEVPSSVLSAAVRTISLMSSTSALSSVFEGYLMNTTLTCSLTVGMIISDLRNGVSYAQILQHNTQPIDSIKDKLEKEKFALREVLYHIFWRRIAECKEQKHWKLSIQPMEPHSESRPRSFYDYKLWPRSVYVLVLWVGSLQRFDLMEEQASILNEEYYDGYIQFHRKFIVPHPDPVSEIVSLTSTVSWFASEVSYSCRPDTAVCNREGSFPRSKGLMPKSDVNQMGQGWGCAQRRTLRALAHTLLLYSPEALLLVDDDTFVNYPLLKDRFASLISGPLQRWPIIFGEFSGSYQHLTSRGLFVGGSGYLMGKETIRRLTARKSKYYVKDKEKAKDIKNKFMGEKEKGKVIEKRLEDDNGDEKLKDAPGSSSGGDRERERDWDSYRERDRDEVFDLVRSPRQRLHLSVYVDAFLIGKNTCPGPCADFHPFRYPPTRAFPAGLDDKDTNKGKVGDIESGDASGLLPNSFLPISVRLVDLCANMMAGEFSCLHSDHSLGRCLIYGAHATPVGMVCQRKITSSASKLSLDGTRSSGTGLGPGLLHLIRATLPTLSDSDYQKIGGNKTMLNEDDSTMFDNALKLHSLTGATLIQIEEIINITVQYGMCFMLRSCDLSQHLTCHRYKASSTRKPPSKVYRHRSYYTGFSSFENVNI